MEGAIYIGATGLDAQQRALEVAANNIANVNTPGFKRAEVSFSELVGGANAPAGASTSPSAPDDELAGVVTNPTRRDFTQGTLRSTGSALDVAIDGDGFIELLGPDGQTLLWRGGTLAINRDGLLIAANGLPLKSSITVPEGATKLSIAADGSVSAVVDGEAQPEDLGKIDLVKVRDIGALSEQDGGVYSIGAEDDLVSADPGNGGAGTFVQGTLENSNVALNDEIVSLLVIQRAYAANAQLVQAGDQLWAIANGLKR